MKTGRVLSLAGGGTFAIIEARALIELYSGQSGHQILNQFDVAIANSGGSIVLAGLVANMTPEQIYDLFQDQSLLHQLYTPADTLDTLFSHIGITPRWAESGKLKALQTLLGAVGAQALNTLNLPIAICAYDLDRSTEVIFRAYDTILDKDADVFVPTLAEAVNASSNAPIVYFDAPATITNQLNPADTRRFWDGGLGSYNLPVRAGLAEAHALGFQTVNILSLGTGSTWRPVGTKTDRLHSGPAGTDLVGTLRCVARDCITAPAIAALLDTYVCPGVSLIHLSPYLRPDGTQNNWSISRNLENSLGVDAWDRLLSLDMDVVEPNDITLIKQYAQAWVSGIIPNEPIRSAILSATLLAGDATFLAGIQRWKQLMNTNQPAVV